MGALQLKNCVKTYPNGHQAVRGISLEIKEGELLVLVGPSGCGKSTMLRTIAGLEQLSGGEIYINEQRVDNLLPAQRDIAMVFQNYALYPHMSVYKNMAYGLINRGYAKQDIEQKVQAAASALKLNDYLDRKPSQLSGGQRQRVAMGRAMVRQPKLFLFDEPLSNLDASLRQAMRLEIKRLQRSLGTTSVFVTHDQVEAMTLADRLVVMNQGKVEQIGSPRQVYHAPQSVFVAQFLGSPPMNLLPATVVNQNSLALSDGQLIDISDWQQGPALKLQQSLWVGLRPEHAELQAKDHGRLNFNASLCEELGANQLLHGKIAGNNFSLNLPEHQQADEGEQAITFSSQHLHLFDKESGQRLPQQ